MALYGDSFLAFQVHIIQHLGLHIAGRDGFRELKETVGQGTFPMVDMGYDTEIANVLHICSYALSKGVQRYGFNVQIWGFANVKIAGILFGRLLSANREIALTEVYMHQFSRGLPYVR
jgi:hypothetical protein